MSKGSERVEKFRKANLDQIHIFVEKGCRNLIDVGAIRDELSRSEFCRQALLNRLGLSVWPFPDMLNQIHLNDDMTPEKAQDTIMKIQINQDRDTATQKWLYEVDGEIDGKVYQTEILLGDLLEITSLFDRIKKTAAENSYLRFANEDIDDSVPLEITGKQIKILRRLLANKK